MRDDVVFRGHPWEAESAPAGNQRPDTGAVLAVGLVAVALGIFLPVLGVSLLAFLLTDAMSMHYRSGGRSRPVPWSRFCRGAGRNLVQGRRQGSNPEPLIKRWRRRASQRAEPPQSGHWMSVHPAA